jgi:hypothetical protein
MDDKKEVFFAQNDNIKLNQVELLKFSKLDDFDLFKNKF